MKKMAESDKNEDKDDSVIWEEVDSFRKIHSNIFDDEDIDKVGFFKKGNKLMRSIKNKFKKNSYLVISLAIIIWLYHTIIFECLLPMYESHLMMKNDFSIKDSVSLLMSNNHMNLNNSMHSNKGLFYLIIFHVLFALFMFSFIRIACMNPGYYHKDYEEVYSLQKYHEAYTQFYLRLILSKKKNFDGASNNSIEFPNINFKSNSLLNIKKNANEDSDKDSIIVDPEENMMNLNKKLKRFEKDINKIRNSEKYRKFWDLNCFNFKNRSLRENICRFCSVIKSERSSHCKHCRNCIRKMDHHCFFINNCLGYNTYKLFMNMLFYSVLICGFCIIIMLDCLDFVIESFSICFYTGLYMFLLMGVCLIGSLLFYFMVYHFSIIIKGLTQVEDTFKYDQRYEDYYDYLKGVSKWKRFTQVFGSNPLIWFLPLRVNNQEQLQGGYIFREIIKFY